LYTKIRFIRILQKLFREKQVFREFFFFFLFFGRLVSACVGRLCCHFADGDCCSWEASAAWVWLMASDVRGLGIRVGVPCLVDEGWFVWLGKVLTQGFAFISRAGMHISAAGMYISARGMYISRAEI